MKIFIIVIAIFVVYSNRAASACGALWERPKALWQSSVEEKHIDVASESAAIVWDENTHTESFIRGAEFRTANASIGFLVPTPTPPKLTGADASVFKTMEEAIKPQMIVRDIPIPVPVPLMSMFLMGGTAGNKLNAVASSVGEDGEEQVDVLSETRVGDYDTAVLKATDTGALSRWLNTHGYVTRPAVQDWLQTYIDKQWTITAFKVSKHGTVSNSLTLAPICMTFHADQPFYPYSEPADTRTVAHPSARLLRMFVFSNHRMEGNMNGGPWPGKIVWANMWTQDELRGYYFPSFHNVELGIPRYMHPTRGWMTVFEDRSSPRPGIADISFTPSNAGPIMPDPDIQYRAVFNQVPLEFCLFVVYVLWRIWPKGLRKKLMK